MIYISVKDNENLDKSLKKYKKKYEKIGIMKELRSRQAFEKPSVTRRMEIKKAAYRQFMQNTHNS